ncbi:MAG: hypothetical protein IJI98_11140 [Methanosphaera sp.]|nr:hypothetical protein [Methanobrevibacter sp.]MBQ6754207.1 hypothetical protein [Bacteroidales bacterium]MBR0351350.1 hypothetical protein [Clostridia bacterium]MBR0473234.1 hypothetical protein [Methanosphaera sp.]
MFVVEYKGNGDYLTKSYWKGVKNHTTMFLSEAHLFTLFELKLAFRTILHNRENYKVYKIDVGGINDIRSDI